MTVIISPAELAVWVIHVLAVLAYVYTYKKLAEEGEGEIFFEPPT